MKQLSTPAGPQRAGLASLLFCLVLSLLLACAPSHAAQTTIAWDAAASGAVAGYKVYYGTSSGSYSRSIDVGNVTSCTIPSLTDGQTYYFNVTSYDASGRQSGYANEISKTFPLSQYLLTVAKSGTGSGTVSGGAISCGTACSALLQSGTGATLSAVAASGSSFSGWSGGGCSGTGPCTVTVNAATTVTATFTKSYSITATAGANGAVKAVNNSAVSQYTDGTSTTSIVSVPAGASQSFSIVPAGGYRVAGVTVDGAAVGAVTTYTFSNVGAAHTIAATFAPAAALTVTASAGSGGSISPAGTSTVSAGGSITYTMVPRTGYHVTGVKVDGVSVGAVGRYTFSNVTASHTISATFGINSYTIAASAGTGGAISPQGNVKVNHGYGRAFTITPGTNYVISSVVVDGVSVGARTSYTFTNVTSNHTIRANFTLK
ncbi:fibronectin type III domain-containing protein [Geomonas sp. RF6]|uniref:InlB B-repeat-containing protein n=1 Tax=Geomonas sp. RF6 TaxID=2897342 RepID=UPI001E4FF4CF|nr:fibronectin type III domain-containing protein [Geomonas sp. RF6]UFS69351.1 fibronectin type III domain-containing protein [Geomonas sp. RF6]